MIDFSNFKNDTARKNGARLICNELIAKALKNEYGEENVVMLPCAIQTENEVDFSAGTVLACVGQTTDNEGCSVDVVVEISAKVKSWNNTGTKRKIKAVNFDDILEALNEATEKVKKKK